VDVHPPLGLPTWSTADVGDMAVQIDAGEARHALSLEQVGEQLPAAASVPEGTLVVVLARTSQRRRGIGHLLGAPPPLSRAERTTALLALGYERVGGGVDPATGQDLAWGYAPRAQS
jgi:hypothetical protein